MTGSITVSDAPANALSKVLVFSKTAGFRHDSIPQGIAAIQALGTANGFTVDATEDGGPVHRRQPRAVRRRGLPLHDRRRPQRRPADRVRELHQGGWRLRGHPCGLRHRVHVAVVRPAARRLLPQPPGRNADRDGQHRGRQRALHDRSPGPLGARRTSGTTSSRRPTPWGQRRRHTDYSPRDSGVHVLATVDESTYDEDDGNTTDDDHPIAWCTELRRRPRLVHGDGPHAGLVRRAPTSAPTSSAA